MATICPAEVCAASPVTEDPPVGAGSICPSLAGGFSGTAWHHTGDEPSERVESKGSNMPVWQILDLADTEGQEGIAHAEAAVSSCALGGRKRERPRGPVALSAQGPKKP